MMQLDEQVRDAFVDVHGNAPDVDAAWASIMARNPLEVGRLDRPRPWRIGAAAAAAALVVVGAAIVVNASGDDAVRVETGSEAHPRPEAVVRLDVSTGSLPDDDRDLATSIEALIGTGAFRDELALRAAVAADDVHVTACRIDGSYRIDVEVSLADGADAIAVAHHVSPSINAVIQANQSNYPIEERLPGPMFTERSVEAQSGAGGPCD